MPYPHPIRLRGPWQYQPLARYDAGELPPPGRIKLPADWGETLGRDFRGRVRYTRAFNRPSGLETRERVWLVAEGADARGAVELNGQPLGEIRGYALPASFDVTERLAARNELAIEVDLPLAAGRPGGLVRDVRLEIRHRLFIERIALWMTQDEERPPRLKLAGLLQGEASAVVNLRVTGLDRELYFGPVSLQEPIELDVDLPADMPQWVSGSPCDMEPIEVKLLQGGEAVWETQRHTAVRPAGADHQNALRLDEILTDESYGQFDRQGQAVIQTLPADWSEEVRPRLAHHPSIVAWAEQ